MNERKAEALRELLRELCRRGRLATLLSLPLADNVDVRIAGRCGEQSHNHSGAAQQPSERKWAHHLQTSS